jgi:hypothetical protein
MIKQITEHLTNCPSYLKKGDEWLAEYFGCGETTIRKIKKNLRMVKRDYIASLG